MLLGVEPTSDLALKMLGIRSIVPRFRDAYFTWHDESQTEPIILIQTRTGGGNRETYRLQNDALTRLPGFLGDSDEPFDTTYAAFIFAVPAAEKEAVMAYLRRTGKPPTFQERFEAAMEALRTAPEAETES